MKTNFNLSDKGEQILEERIRPIAAKKLKRKPNKDELIELAIEIAGSLTYMESDEFRNLTGLEK
jgi:hypothetical protein